MPWPEIIALVWAAVFVICVGILGRAGGDAGLEGRPEQSPLTWAALVFVAGSLLVLIAVPLALGS